MTKAEKKSIERAITDNTTQSPATRQDLAVAFHALKRKNVPVKTIAGISCYSVSGVYKIMKDYPQK